MKKIAMLLLSLMLALSVVPVCAEDIYLPGDRVEDFTVTLQDGTEATLSELLKDYKAVVINIWATWCGPCCREFPYMNEAYEQYKDRIALLCLSPFDNNESITAFMQQNQLTLPMGYDAPGLGNRFVLRGYPTTVVIDQTGKYVYYECGSMPYTEAFVELF